MKWYSLDMLNVRVLYVFFAGFHTGKYGLLRESTVLCTGVRVGYVLSTYLVRIPEIHETSGKMNINEPNYTTDVDNESTIGYHSSYNHNSPIGYDIEVGLFP